MQKGVRVTLRVVLILLTLLEAVGFGSAGTGKFYKDFWSVSFAAWGYPVWFRDGIGVLEVLGAVGLVVPRFAAWAAIGLAAIMVGAAITSGLHPLTEPRFTWVTPAFHICLLTAIAALRWKERWRG